MNSSYHITEGLTDNLRIWNETDFNYPANKAVHTLIEEQVLRFADKIAVTYLDETLTYAELNEASNRLAGVFLSQGIQKGDVIGLAIDRSQYIVVALLAILKSGAAYVPIDLEYPDERIDFMLQDAGAKILLTSEKYKGRFHSPALEILLEDVMKEGVNYSKDNPGLDVTEKDLAYILYTSGTTGRPKGVMIEHGNFVNLLCAMLQKNIINESDKLLAVTTTAFDIAGLELFLPLLTGAEIIITDEVVSRDGYALLDMVQKKGISIMQATPMTWKMMLAAGWGEKLNLKILCCGEPLLPALANQLIPGCTHLYNYYGPTETTIYSTGTEIRADDETITIGRPIGNTKIYIMNEDLKLLPAGEEGIIYIAGKGVARGYKNLPELTATSFVNNPFSTNKDDKMFRTGDIGKWTSDGNIYFMGREDHQLKIRGYRIEPSTIESVLLREKEIKDAVVIAREDIPDNKTIAAYIVLKEGLNFSENITEELLAIWKKLVAEKLPKFMIPNDFVIMDKLPLLASGKIDRKSLPKPKKSINTNFEAPVSDLEKTLHSIWVKALRLDVVGINDDFFELGGHSLIAVMIMGNIEKATGKKLPINTLFSFPTIRQLSALLGADNSFLYKGLVVPIKPGGTKPALYLVHGDGLNVMVFNSIGRNMDKDQPVFGLQAQGLDGRVETYDDMKKIAGHYISEIQKNDPQGPYCLAGYSFGGIVAFEMAQQLQGAGKSVRMLAMFDTDVGNIDYKDSAAKKLIKKIGLQFPKMLFILRSLFSQPKDMLDYQGFVLKRKYAHLFSKTGLNTMAEPEQYSEHEKNIIKKHLKAYKNYTMVPYNGKIDLFRVQKRVYFLEDPEFLGWKPYAEKGVYIHEVPGDHKTFLLSPNDKILAQILQSVINERISEKD